MRVAVIGKTGQLACALAQQAKGTGINCVFFGRSEIDLTAPEDKIESFVAGLKAFHAVIIAAAYTNVDAAETDEAAAFAVNAVAPAAIARACAKNDLPLLHVSTDYVFSGKATAPYRETDAAAPLNVYGSTKLAGETAILRAYDKAVIFRTSWLFDGQHKNFVTTILSLAHKVEYEKNGLKIVADQIGRPTYAGHFAAGILNALPYICREDISGIFHVTNAGRAVTRADFARAILRSAGLSAKVSVADIPSAAFNTAAKRPLFAPLDTTKFETKFMPLPSWGGGLDLACADWRAVQKR